MVGVELHRTAPVLAVRFAHGALFDAVIHGIAHQMHQRVANFFDHGLVKLSLGAGDDEIDFLADFLRNIAYNAVEAVEGFTDLDHAQLQCRVADVFNKARKDGGRLHQFALAAALGEQMGRGAGNHQFADEIDQLVELVGLDADQPGFDGLFLADLGLFVHGRINDGFLDNFGVDQDFADLQRRRGFFAGFDSWLGRLLENQCLLQLGLGQGAAAHENFAETHVVFRQFLDQLEVFGQLAVRWQDTQFAIIGAEIEDALNVGL
ncbi:MAG: hypothetical protein ACD_10C00233G0002 [uncultured bacterium]|nr:MAG: hypothetical protein ACD_10C00233G0002 [uncultured bacterium]